ncbi:hypothetical protein APR04_003971 [Promicromonospora umidemergens]|uniref:Uncharacterized protein n=1 Tax=Promicromonospora umidemergens TaxID=629679 RepID=A0ABP8X6F5_9MICO|nr:hypothetical protein [Promicromonospora umidemergens]MCP2285044.1 hypothetical protein [Promicromonospora umidemergens]
MSATRRKGSRDGRAASRAGGPPATNALTWAESLAAGEAAPGASALEWAEGLTENEPAPSPWGSGAAAAPADPAPADGTGGSPWGAVPAPAVPDGESDGDANPWGSVAAAEPAVTRGRGKNAGGKSGKGSKSRSKGKGAKAAASGVPKSEPAPTPAGGFPLNAGPVADDVDVPPAQLPAAVPSEPVPVPMPDDASLAVPDGPGGPDGSALPSKSESRKTGKKRGKGRIPGPSTAQQKRIRKTLRRGLPKVLDQPLVLVLAGVTAAALGLGTGWGTTFFQGEDVISDADAASCAQTQMAWTQAANAQSAMVEDQPETLRKGFINARNALEGVTPPEAIAKDWAVAFTYYSTVANNIEKVKANDGPAVSSAVGGAQEELDTEAMVESSQRVQEYVASNCRS